MGEAESGDVSGRTHNVWTVVVAAGSGSRFGRPKLLLELAGQRVLDWSLAAAKPQSSGLVVVVGAAEHDVIVESLAAADEVGPTMRVVRGGATRSESVRCGLAEVPPDATVVVIHDGARPAAPSDLFTVVIEPVANGDADAAIPVVPIVDTLRWRDGPIIDRDQVVAVQTPQAFDAQFLRRAHEGAPDATDDAALVEMIGGRVLQVPGVAENRKLTVPPDLPTLEALLAERQRSSL